MNFVNFSHSQNSNINIPMCVTKEHNDCAQKRQRDLTANLQSNGTCKPCKKYDYSGMQTFESENVEDKYMHQKILTYQFAYPQVLTIYQEYLIYDGIGMIGSVGGTLGMFIGFSFSNVISSTLNFLQFYMNIKQNLEQHLK